MAHGIEGRHGAAGHAHVSGAMRQFLLEGAMEFIQKDGVPGINVKLGARRILLNKNKRLHYAKQAE